MPATRGAFAQLLAPGLGAIIFDELETLPEEYSQIFNIYSSTSAYEEDQLVAGLGAIPKKPEGESIAYDEPIQGGSKRFTHESFGLGFQVTREMWDDDKYGIMKRVSQDFAGGIRQTLEAAYANVLNLGFTSTTTIDGEYLFSTAHPLLGGGTYPNRLSTDAALSVSGLQEALLIFEKMVNERGLLRRLMPEFLEIPSDLQFVAGEILQSSYVPYSGSNEVNVMQGRLLPRINHYFSSATAWFVTAPKSKHTLKGYWRTQPQFDSQDDFGTKGASFSVFFRFSCGATYWHGVLGSAGA
jgi:phage major head subunit gpT-like protein